MEFMPIDASVPMDVAITDAKVATIIVLYNDDIIDLSLKSCIYQSRVNPFHTPPNFDLLKEFITSTIIGKYKNKNIKTI